MIHGFLLRVDTVPSGNFKATYLKILYDSSPSVKNNRPGSLVRTVEGPGLGLLGIGDQIFGLQQWAAAAAGLRTSNLTSCCVFMFQPCAGQGVCFVSVFAFWPMSSYLIVRRVFPRGCLTI